VNGIDDALEHARRLVRGAGRPDVDSLAETALPDEPPTETFETELREPGTEWVEAARAAETIPDKGVTDLEVDRASSGRSSQITAAVELLITVVERLRTEYRAGREAAELLAAEHRDLRARHDQLRDVVQTQQGRLDDFDVLTVDLPQQRTMLRLILVGTGFVVPSVVLILGLLLTLVCR
jgi:hypothetical protein